MNIKKKLIKNSFIQKILGLFATIYIYIVLKTSKIHYQNISIPEEYWANEKPFILAFWHSQLMMISFSWTIESKLNILASGHSDGRFGAIIGNYFNLNNIPTYDKNKKVSLKPIFQLLKQKKYVGISPDGPRGPKEKVAEGIIKIAKTANVPIIPIGFWSSKNFKLKSWDSFLVTRPFSKCLFVWGQPIFIPKDLNGKNLLFFQDMLKKNINKCINNAKINCQ